MCGYVYAVRASCARASERSLAYVCATAWARPADSLLSSSSVLRTKTRFIHAANVSAHRQRGDSGRAILTHASAATSMSNLAASKSTPSSAACASFALAAFTPASALACARSAQPARIGQRAIRIPVAAIAAFSLRVRTCALVGEDVLRSEAEDLLEGRLGQDGLAPDRAQPAHHARAQLHVEDEEV